MSNSTFFSSEFNKALENLTPDQKLTLKEHVNLNEDDISNAGGLTKVEAGIGVGVTASALTGAAATQVNSILSHVNASAAIAASKKAILAAGFDTYTDLLAYLPQMVDGDRTTVAITDTGTHGSSIPNAGVYVKQGGVLVRLANSESQLTDAARDNAVVAATTASTSTSVAATAASLAMTVAQAYTNFRETRAAGVAAFEVDEYFSSAETGSLRAYKRIATAPYYQDLGDAAAAISPTVLASTTGAALIGTADGESVQEVATQHRIIVGQTHINLHSQYGVKPNGAQTIAARTAAIQAAFDNAPIGCVLHLPPGPHTVNDELLFSRQMDIQGHGSMLLSVPGPAKSGIKVRIVEAIGQAPGYPNDCRGMHWRDFIMQVSGPCLNGLDVQHEPGQSADVIAVLKMKIEGGRYAVPDDAVGHAIRFGGLAAQKHIVTGVEVINGINLDGCADGVRFEFCTVFGTKRAFLIDLAEGAFCTIIRDNILVARDGAMEVRGGSQVHFIGNQIEQGDGTPNQGLFNCSVLIYGVSYRQRGHLILGNNFGGGNNVKNNIVIAGGPTVGGGDYDLRDILIDENTFNTAAYTWDGSPNSPLDILIANSLVKYTRIGNRNKLRGHGSARGGSVFSIYPAVNGNILNDRDLLAVTDLGEGTYGVWKNSSTLALQNVYAGTMRYRKTEDDELVFEGNLTSGANAANTVIGTLPVGFRPVETAYRPVVVVTPGVGAKIIPLCFAASGEILLGAPIDNGVSIDFNGVTLMIKGRASYSPGA